MKKDLTQGPILKSMLLFSLPMILGNLLQQCYNIADTLIVGRFLGRNALAAVGSSFSLMIFITSIILGLSMGSGTLFSMRYGERNERGLREAASSSFVVIAMSSVLLTIASYIALDSLKRLLNVPEEVWPDMRDYLLVIFSGILATFLYNWFSSFLRALGNSVAPLVFLAVSTVLNILLDLFFVVTLERGTKGAAEATVISQYLSGLLIAVYALATTEECRIALGSISRKSIKEVTGFSYLTSLQQSVMNLGILMVQGRVNWFGTDVMAAFASGVKIDAFAYMPVQDYGNAFSTFVAQNYGAGRKDRIEKGMKIAFASSALFSLAISILVFVCAPLLMGIFVDAGETEVIAIGAQYLRIEGAFYIGIGCLFLFYGLYRALGRPGMSVVLTIVSLGTRVVLSYTLSAIPQIGVLGIWWSIPIGWALADILGGLYFAFRRKDLLKGME